MQVGLDFGTTNSVVSYWDDNSKEPRVFSYLNGNFTPSLVAFDTFSKEVYGIGAEAKNKWDNNPSRYKLLQTFKTLLSHTDSSAYEKNGWGSEKSPEEISQSFIDWLLLSSSGSFTKNNGDISNLVVSVPEFWQRETVNNGAERLQKIIKNLNLPLKQLISEPLAAASYYIWKSKLKKAEEKKVLVFDLGGGTFDVSWCKASRNKVEVLGFEGNDEDLAGMYHLREIIRNALKRQKRILEETDPEFQKLVWRLENYLCGDKEGKSLEKLFERFKKDATSYDVEVEILDGFPIYAGDIFNAFGKIYEGIHSVLKKLEDKNSDLRSFDQVLMVGGFSQYFLVRKTILDYFRLQEDDERVKTISKNDGYLAIAHGAAIIAAEQIKIVERYPHSISYNTKTINNKNFDLKIIEADKVIANGEINFASSPVKVIHSKFKLSGLIYPNGKKNDPVFFQKPIELKGIDISKDQLFKVGIEIDKSNIASFVIEAPDGKVHKCSMGNLFDDSLLVIKEKE